MSKIKHTPGPWKINGGGEGGIEIGTADHETHICTAQDRSQWGRHDAVEAEYLRPTAELITLAPTAPHECDDPKCPGNLNRQRIEVYTSTILGLKELLNDISNGSIEMKDVRREIDSILAKASAIDK